MNTNKKGDSTRDIICIDFQFGLRSYEEEMKHIEKMKALALEESNERRLSELSYLEQKTISRKDLHRSMTKDEIREELYKNGAPITYTWVNRQTGERISETIVYRMLYRNPSKAKTGSCMFVREELYDVAKDWLTMGLEDKMSYDNAKIVEMSAYAPLTTSAIEGRVHIDPEDILILEDQDSFFRTVADVVKSVDYKTTERVFDEQYFQEKGKKRYVKKQCVKKRCKIDREETDVKNTLWDGMALIESSVLPGWCNGMALLRNHFFKACAFKARIQDFIQDYCRENNIDYDTYEICDMYGNKHLAKNIKMITTDNATKFKKFVNLMGGTPGAAYQYWVDRLRADGNIWGIVKTDHPSKLGDVQQMSYQMINSLPCSKEDVVNICRTTVDYVEKLKEDDDEFVKYLRANATVVNHYNMLADLYEWNSDFQSTGLWRNDKSQIIQKYVNFLRKGKIAVPGDNLTVCGNPYALLLYTVGKDWKDDPTLGPEDGTIQVYTKRFGDGEYLCGIRSPNNSSNNLAYYHNKWHPLMDNYFEFSNNIMAVNCIETDVQARLNGMDSMGRF